MKNFFLTLKIIRVVMMVILFGFLGYFELPWWFLFVAAALVAVSLAVSEVIGTEEQDEQDY